MLEGKKILIGITASIAAYKIPLLIRLLKKAGASVKVVLTPDAHDFVTTLTLSVLTENPVVTEPFDPNTGEWNSHVDMGLWADLMLIAPASANTIAKMATGIADKLLLTTYLSAKCPVFFAPAMDLDMYQHPTTQSNIEQLVHRGHKLIEPGTGELASGLCGEGRMEEPSIIFEIIKKHFHSSTSFQGKRVLITAGPTYERIDPVRFIGNFSSGLMGFELAECFADKGAEVYLVTGPVHLKTKNNNIYRLDVESAGQMYKACMETREKADIIVMAAAVADFSPEQPASEKIKKKENLQLKLKKTIDILASLGKSKSDNQYLVGFALETENELQNAVAKLENKNLDMIVLNSLNDKEAGFGKSTNKITIIDKQGSITTFDAKPKSQVAEDILNVILKKTKNQG